MKPGTDGKSGIKRVAVILFIFICVACAAGFIAEGGKGEYQDTSFVMDTVESIHIYGGRKKDVSDLEKKMSELDDRISWRKSSSETAVINNTLSGDGKGIKTVKISSDMSRWLHDSCSVMLDSNGALDITMLPIARLWNIEDDPHIPKDSDLARAMSLTGYKRIIKADQSSGTLKAVSGTSIDLGAVGKGIGTDQAKDFLKKRGVKAAAVSLGGSILAYGTKPGNKEWKIGVQDPRGETGTTMGVLTLHGTTYISTSGDYEKYFIENGRRYCHIFDDRTGYPADSGLISVTVVCDSGLYSDALSTACFVAGISESEKLLKKYNAEAVFIDSRKNVYVTGGLVKSFEITDSSYHMEQTDEK